MLKNLKYLLVFSLLIIGSFVFNFSRAEAADRYWVVGTDSWADYDNHWSASSGGATADGNLPTASDNCIFDTNSIAVDGAYSVSIGNGINATCNDFTMDGPGSGFNVTLSSPGFNSKSLTISGSMNLIGGSADITRTYDGTLTFNSTSGTKTITTNGVSLSSPIFDGVGGTWQIQDTFNVSGTLTLSNGSLDTNNQTINANILQSNGSAARTLSLGSSAVNACIDFGTSPSNFTFNAGTSIVTCTGGYDFNGGGKTFYDVVYTVNGENRPFRGANTFHDLTLNGDASPTTSMALYGNQTITADLGIDGNSDVHRILIESFDTSSNVGTPRTISAGTVSVSNADFQDIVGAGAADWDISASVGRAGDCQGNSGITFSTPVTRYWVGGAGNWSDTAMWSNTSGGGSGSSVPLCSDNVVFDVNSFDSTSQEVVADTGRLGKNVTFVGIINDPNIDLLSYTNSLYGSLTWDIGVTTTDEGSLSFKGRGSETIDLNGSTLGLYLTIDSFGGTYTLSDDLNVSHDFTFNSGTFDANGFDLLMPKFYSSTSNAKTLNMGSGTWEISGVDGFWDIGSASNLTLNAETSTIKVTDTSGSERIFYGDGETYYNFWSDAGISTGDLKIDGSNTFNDFKDTGTAAHNILFTNGTTQTVSTFNVSGTLGNLITLNSDNDGDTFALVKTGGGTISSDYLNIQHSVATPADTWYAGLNSTDNQANATAGSGWIFTVPPVVVEESSHSSSGSRSKARINVLSVPIITPLDPQLPSDCLVGDKFSSMTGQPCPLVVNVPPAATFVFLNNLSLGMPNPDVK